jgi:hypothetical protein
MDWSDLHKPGKNGLLLIMISLVWWGKVSAREGSWLEAVVDVTEVLLCMQKASGGSKGPKANPLRGSGAANADSTVTPKRGRRAVAAVRGSKRHKAG